MSGQEKAGRWTPHVVPMHAVSSSGESLSGETLPVPIYPPMDEGSGYRWALVSTVWQVIRAQIQPGYAEGMAMIVPTGQWVWTWERRRIL